MRKLLIIIATALFVILLGVNACQPGGDETHTPIPTKDLFPAVGEQAPDDIVPTPGGVAYRANVHQQGVENPWPPIESVEVELGSGSNAVNVKYRDYIETKAGQTRNNIFYVRRRGGFWDSRLNLYAVDIPSSIKVFQEGGGGLPGTLASVLVIEISKDVKPGQYTFEIGVEINGKDYGTVPCTIRVLE